MSSGTQRKPNLLREAKQLGVGVPLARIEPSMTSPQTNQPAAKAQAALAIGALGVVFGDIGTSPLYTMRECMAHLPAGDRAEGVLGILSLIFWEIGRAHV